MIESVNNPKIKEYSKLQNKKYRDESGLFIVEGDHLVEEALKKISDNKGGGKDGKAGVSNVSTVNKNHYNDTMNNIYLR
jgi:hypothetical protein